MTKKEIYEKLSKINVGEKIEKTYKGMSYLSWAYAWEFMKLNFPEFERIIHESEGKHFFTDGKTAWVKVTVKIGELQETEILPVMDGANKPILLEKITSFDITRSIQRCFVKCCALFGLGLYVFQGEDIPKDEVKPEKTAQNHQEAPKKEKPEPKPTEEKKAAKIDAAKTDDLEKDFAEEVASFERMMLEQRSLSDQEKDWLKGFVTMGLKKEFKFSEDEQKYIRLQLPKKAKPAEKPEVKEVSNNTPKCTDDFGI